MARRKYGMHSLHVKNNTAGTSNEISFSVLDAKVQKQDATEKQKFENPLGKIALFSLPGKRKVKGEPTQEESLPVSQNVAQPQGATLLKKTMSQSKNTTPPPRGLPLPTQKLLAAPSSTSNAAPHTAPHAASNTPPNTSLGAPANASRPALLPVPSSAHNKKRRFAWSRVAIVGAVCIALAAVSCGVYALTRGMYEEYLINQSHQQAITSSLAEVVKADEILSEMDACFTNMLSDTSLSAMKNVESKLPLAEKYLSNAESIIERVQGSLTETKDIQAAQNTQEAIKTRQAMLTKGEALINEALLVSEECAALENVWDSLLAADTQVKEIVADFSALNTTGVEQTITSAQNAQHAFETAQESISALKTQYPSLVLSSYTSYVQLRVEALDHLIAACNAVLAEDIELAQTEVSEYNNYDNRAVEQANSFPSNITDAPVGPFLERVETFSSDYKTLQEQAAKLDTQLREYLRSVST